MCSSHGLVVVSIVNDSVVTDTIDYDIVSLVAIYFSETVKVSNRKGIES